MTSQGGYYTPIMSRQCIGQAPVQHPWFPAVVGCLMQSQCSYVCIVMWRVCPLASIKRLVLTADLEQNHGQHVTLPREGWAGNHLKELSWPGEHSCSPLHPDHWGPWSSNPSTCPWQHLGVHADMILKWEGTLVSCPGASTVYIPLHRSTSSWSILWASVSVQGHGRAGQGVLSSRCHWDNLMSPGWSCRVEQHGYVWHQFLLAGAGGVPCVWGRWLAAPARCCERGDTEREGERVVSFVCGRSVCQSTTALSYSCLIRERAWIQW